MHAVLYRWRVKPGGDEAFQRGWAQLTDSIRAQCGSYGSRLHRADDGTWVAYALWPDRATWEACTPDDPAASRLLGDASSRATTRSTSPSSTTGSRVLPTPEGRRATNRSARWLHTILGLSS